MAELRVQLRDGDDRHAIAQRTEYAADHVAVVCVCGFRADVRPEHELIMWAMHLAAPHSDAPGLASVYALAAQAVAISQGRRDPAPAALHVSQGSKCRHNLYVRTPPGRPDRLIGQQQSPEAAAYLADAANHAGDDSLLAMVAATLPEVAER